MEPRTDAFRVLSVHEDGTEEEAVPQLMRNTLFGALWGDDKATLLRVDLPKGEDSFERDESRMKLVHQLQQLPAARRSRCSPRPHRPRVRVVSGRAGGRWRARARCSRRDGLQDLRMRRSR